MLSQKINLEFYRGVVNHEASTKLAALFAEWKGAHDQLLHTPEESQLSPIVHPEALALMTTLSLRIAVIEEQLNRLQSGEEIDFVKLDANQAAFLAEMEEVVRLLEVNSSNKLSLIVRTEVFLLILSIVVIILEAVFIFYPIHQKLLKSLKELSESKKVLQGHLAELERKNHDLEQFVYVASHDLQEPLRTVISFTQLLQRKHEKQFEEGGKKEISFIIDATKRMKALIAGLLDYTNIGRVKEIKSVDCNKLLDAVRQDLYVILEEKQAKLVVKELPIIKAYETEIRQLFQNLIINALKFQKAEEQPEIVISATESGEKYQFSIQDNGIGIASEFRERIFLIFKRLHTIDEYKGTGIGLAKCKKIVELHNGRIWVDSRGNEGSIFSFTISKNLS